MRSRETLALAALAVGLASTLEAVVTIEWWYPYCSFPDSGPASAVFGAPLPYARFSGVSSLQYEVMPHVMALDVALIGGAIAAFAVRFARRVAGPRRRLLARVALVLGVTLILVRLTCLAFGVHSGFVRPVGSIANPPFDHYDEYRPLRPATGWHSYCAP